MSAVAARLGGDCGIRSNGMAVASLLIEYSILAILKAFIVLHFEKTVHLTPFSVTAEMCRATVEIGAETSWKAAT
jgi:hypothetical protein